MNRPNFICVGAQKAGTTTLYDILYQHPQIFLPETKELHFFDWDKNYSQGEEWYFEHFQDVKNEKSIGEITPNYMFTDFVPEKMFQLLGKDLKIIFLLRNPMNRSFSHYLMKLRNDKTDKSFYNETKIINIDNKKLFLKENPIIGRSLYDLQINKYLKYFDKKNMFFAIFETDFLKNQKETIDNICEFLEVNKYEFKLDIQSGKASNIKSKKLNKAIYNENIVKNILKLIFNDKIKAKVKKYLKKLNKKDKINYDEREKYREFLNEKIFSQSIKHLEKIINKNLSFWLENKK